jgi:uncharacterized protein (DUF58 family)
MLEDPITARAVDLLLQITKRAERAIWISLAPFAFGFMSYFWGAEIYIALMFTILTGLIIGVEHNLAMIYLRNEFAELASKSPVAASEARKQIVEMKKDRRFWRSLN